MYVFVVVVVFSVCFLIFFIVVHLVIWGAPFSSETSFGFIFRCFLLASSFLVVLFVYLQWHTVGAEIKVPSVENPEL